MKDTYYFPHDYNARQDPKLQDVMAHHGVAGVGIYWCLVEMLYEQGGVIPLKAVKGIAYALHVDSEVVSSIINDFDLFQVEGDDFVSNSVNIRMNKRAEISEKRRKAIEARWGKKGDSDTEELQNDTNVLQKNNTCNTNVIQNDTNKIKGKEIKLKEIEKENKEDINSSSSSTRAREDFKIEDLKNEAIWLESMAMRYKQTIQEIIKWIDVFALDAQCRDTTHTGQRDMKTHFCDWLRIQLEQQARKTSKPAGKMQQTNDALAAYIESLSN